MTNSNTCSHNKIVLDQGPQVMKISGFKSKIGIQNMKKVVITGVSTGIGYASAKILCNSGYIVYGSVRTNVDAERIASELGVNFHPLIFDVTDLQGVLNGARKVKSELNLEKLKDNKIDLVAFWDERYPYLYKSIKNPPVYLYCKGDLSLLNQQSVAIVGTRKCSDYGKKIAFRTAKELVSHDFTIVSGLALGIDTAAHEGAIAANGKTISVLVDVHNIYPKENILLSEKILETGGLLFAENIPGTELREGLFVARNRLQSGLSLAVFPIESNIDGGTMHTAKFAKEQGRLLYCPDLRSISNYPLNSPVHSGIDELVSDGDAEVYTSSSYRELSNALELRKNILYSNIESK